MCKSIHQINVILEKCVEKRNTFWLQLSGNCMKSSNDTKITYNNSRTGMRTHCKKKEKTVGPA